MSSDKVQILVVDDDISHCTILQALLRGWGYQVGWLTTACRRWSRSISRSSTGAVRYPYGGDGRYRNVKRD